MTRNDLQYVLIGSVIFALGVFSGASDFPSAFSHIKWTDVAILLVTFFGFCFAFITYNRWLLDKKKEDSYLVAKKYLAALENVQEVLDELFFQYNHLCPAPGLPVPSKESSLQRLQYITTVWNDLYYARTGLYKAKTELEFWHVTLTEPFALKHETVIKELQSINAITRALNNQLFHMVESYDGEKINSVVQHKKSYDERYSVVKNILKERIQLGFEKVFKFQAL